MSYNGYTDYATWRVKMDLFSNIKFTEPVTADDLIEMATEMVFDNYEMKQGSHNVEDYARIFLALPNYKEIADLINEEIELKLYKITMNYSLKQVLMERDGMTGVEADKEIKDTLSRVFEGENPETILFEEYGLEPDYIWDLI